MSAEMFSKTRDECADWLAQKTYHALLTVYHLPMVPWEKASAEQRSYCRRHALVSLQEADTHLAAWGMLTPVEDAPVVKILSVEPVPPTAPSYQPAPEYRVYRVSFSDGRHGDVSSPWLVRCANGWLKSQQPVSAQIIYEQERPDVARLIDLNVETRRVGLDRAVHS
jgi:hypothetical protein